MQEERPNQARQPASAEQPLLCVNMSALKGDEEMRRMFGRDIVQLSHQEDQAADLGEATEHVSPQQPGRGYACYQTGTPCSCGSLWSQRHFKGNQACTVQRQTCGPDKVPRTIGLRRNWLTCIVISWMSHQASLDSAVGRCRAHWQQAGQAGGGAAGPPQAAASEERAPDHAAGHLAAL